MRVVLVAGGTGGHVFPAIALGEYLRDQKGCEILFVGVNNKMEATEVPKHDIKFVGLEMRGFVGSVANRLKCLQLVAKNIGVSKKLLKEFKPDIVIGFGGYICVPVLLAAKQMNIPTMLHEQNSVAGLANKILGKTADGIVICFQNAFDTFPKEKTKLLGSPRASMLTLKEKDSSILSELQVLGGRKLVYIVMGSLGSESVNAAMSDVIRELSKNNDIELVYVTGPKHYEDVVSTLGELPPHIHVVAFTDQERLLPFVDVMVCRAGATTIAELCALGVPSILIPSPYVAHNHQYLNAKELVDKGACLLVEEKDLTCDVVTGKILELCGNDAMRKELSDHAKTFGRLDACERISEYIHELIK
ncbi:MAG: undecaprenyldiphospho-muramoylpentapeptide beta-N-acetylglucosaminyltransferase [Erysipelotrichales bacterium]|nr:undecaprenyldiphospho-muramoylpentapeptide beta-N-acetylglucosaminyltransferase [Erysipelotrichales bacterium]